MTYARLTDPLEVDDALSNCDIILKEEEFHASELKGIN